MDNLKTWTLSGLADWLAFMQTWWSDTAAINCSSTFQRNGNNITFYKVDYNYAVYCLSVCLDG